MIAFCPLLADINNTDEEDPEASTFVLPKFVNPIKYAASNRAAKGRRNSKEPGGDVEMGLENWSDDAVPEPARSVAGMSTMNRRIEVSNPLPIDEETTCS